MPENEVHFESWQLIIQLNNDRVEVQMKLKLRQGGHKCTKQMSIFEPKLFTSCTSNS